MDKYLTVGELIGYLKKGYVAYANDVEGKEHKIEGPVEAGQVQVNGKTTSLSTVMWGLGKKNFLGEEKIDVYLVKQQ